MRDNRAYISENIYFIALAAGLKPASSDLSTLIYITAVLFFLDDYQQLFKLFVCKIT